MSPAVFRSSAYWAYLSLGMATAAWPLLSDIIAQFPSSSGFILRDWYEKARITTPISGGWYPVYFLMISLCFLSPCIALLISARSKYLFAVSVAIFALYIWIDYSKWDDFVCRYVHSGNEFSYCQRNIGPTDLFFLLLSASSSVFVVIYIVVVYLKKCQ